MDILLQALTLPMLGAGLWWGYRRWVSPHQERLDPLGIGLLLLVILTLMGGFFGSPFWWMDEPRSFSWDLPPLASRMLAAAGWSFVALTFLALQRPTPRRLRLTLLVLATYLVPLVLVILLFHLKDFDFAAPLTYAFFLLAGGMSLATLFYLLRQPAILPDDPEELLPPPPLVQGWLVAVGVITALWGAALFATDSGPAPLIWVWPGDLLTSWLIAVMLFAIAVGAATSWRSAPLAHMMLAMATVYGLGLALASGWNALLAKPIQPSYWWFLD
ncbi:MAG: hypothetical protein H0T73_23930 [Ardenticatenales bacterium]|nr:hypothetical protein [Ardenticatenales bacterium]